MQVYRVGGSVRDALLGQASADQDFVVVGATAKALLDAGYRPVGKDFPVFLHPHTGAEYALARRERKSGIGHRGFELDFGPEVSLEEDLSRRDLTINAMAQDETGRLIDPFGGRQDLQAGVLRHVSPAFVEDPLRVLRVARFAARWPHFSIALDTLGLMRQISGSGELAHLSAERIWQEWRKGLLARAPHRMLQVLREAGALFRLLPELGLQAEAALQRAALAQANPDSLAQRYALLFWPPGRTGTGAQAGAKGPVGLSAVKARSAAWRVPQSCADMARLLAELGPALAQRPPADAGETLHLLMRADVLRRAARWHTLLQAAAMAQPAAEPHAGVWARLAQALAEVPAAEIASRHAAQRAGRSATHEAQEGAAGAFGVAALVEDARRARIAAVLQAWEPDHEA
jgi:tRNA nucleotidyltransferase (CCA-adding enzyme)